MPLYTCLLYTSDAADDSLRVDLGGRRIIKKNVEAIIKTSSVQFEVELVLPKEVN